MEKENRYRKQYALKESPIQNLREIRELGMEAFLDHQKQRFACPECGDVLSVHTGKCRNCGYMRNTDKTTYREILHNEYGLLQDFTYEAIYLPEGVNPPDRTIIEQPELAVYYKDFGFDAADLSMVADHGGEVVGMVWTRIMDDYGHVEEGTPSLAISVLKEYRGHGIGTRLMQEMLALLQKHGYKKVSLSVQKQNYAVGMYKRAGFKVIGENDEEYLMMCSMRD